MDIFDRLWDIEYKIRRLREKREEAFNDALPSAVAYKADKVQTSSVGFRIEDAVIKCTEIDQKIESLEIEKLNLQKKLVKAIKILPNREKYAIQLRYINMERWKQVCCIMEISKQRAHKLCKQGKTKILEKYVSLANVDHVD